MTKSKSGCLRQEKKSKRLLQFLVTFLCASPSTHSAQVLADIFAVFLIYRSVYLKPKCVSSEFFQKIILLSSEIFEDTNRFLLLHPNLCHLLKLNNFDWVSLSFTEKVNHVNQKPKTVRKLFQVIPSENIKHLEIGLTHNTFLSICDQLDSSYHPNRSLNIRFFSKIHNYSPRVANKATIQLLEKFNNPSTKVIDDILFSYFSYPRFLSRNDVFSVCTQKYFPENYYSTKHFTANDLQCKVLSISGDADRTGIDSFLVTNDNTSLLQASNYHGFLPSEEYYEIKHSDTDLVPSLGLNSALRSLIPDGFDKYVSQIVSWCNLFVTRSQNDPQLLPFFLVNGAEGSGKSMLLKNAAKTLGFQYYQTDCVFLQATTPGYSEAQLKILFSKFSKCAPCLIHFSNFEALCVNANGSKDDRLVSSFINHFCELKSEQQVIIFATCQDSSEISGSVARLFLETLNIDPLSQSDRKLVLLWALDQQNLKVEPATLENLSKQTTGFLYADLLNLVSHTILNFHRGQSNTGCNNVYLKFHDFEDAFKRIQADHATSIGSPQIPQVSWEDVGGLASLKKEILKSLSPLPFTNSLRRTGLLLHGPPGTGKTLLAKAIATECNFNFLSVKGPELLNMYVGQSEQNVREVFSRARSASPCVVFFDELDSLAPNRGKNGDSGGVMDRVVSQLLAEMDEVQKLEGIFVLAATNRPDLIDPALLRPGRLDKLLYVGLCEDKESKLHVLKAVTRKYNLKDDVKMDEIANSLNREVSGADISAICSAAWLNAARRLIFEYEARKGQEKTPLNEIVVVSKQDFLLSLNAVS